MSASSPFADGLEKGVVRILACEECGVHQILDPAACRYCGSTALAWIATDVAGHVRAVSQVHRAPSAAFEPLVPFTLVLVDLDGGGRLMGHGATDIAIGARVRATVFEGAGLPLLRFEPEEVEQ